MNKLRKRVILQSDPRQLALDALEAVENGEFLGQALNGGSPLLSPEDKALAKNLAYASVRHKSRLDFIVKSKLINKHARPKVMAILRLGVCQILFFDRLSDHAIVDRTVNLAKTGTPGRQGLVNAVLREILRDKATVWGWPEELDGRDVDPLKRLAVFYSHPLWLVESLFKSLGYRETRALLVANNQPVPPTIRVNLKKISREALALRLPFPTEETKYSPFGLIPLTFPGRPESWPGYKEGYFAIQDEASQIIGLLAGSPKRVLDACAGLGGKSFAMASVFSEDAKIVALDPNASRLKQLRREVARLGFERRIEVACGDVLVDRAKDDFDLVLADAPCVGAGVIRRRPDLKWLKSKEDVGRLTDLQLKILLASASKVAKGGRLIYAVCSFLEEEGPLTLQKFLAARPDFRPVPSEDLPKELRGLSPAPGQVRLWPHRERTDGFFYGLMERSG